MPWQLTVLRLALRASPAPIRERWAARLFLTTRHHGEPEREVEWRRRGTPLRIAGHAATGFGDAAAPVALLMHGWEGRGLQLSAYIEPLVEAGYHVVALDGPSHGRSPTGRPAIPTFAELVGQAMEELDVRIMVAHSMGSAACIVAGLQAGFTGRLLCLGGPPHPLHVLDRARSFMRLPASGEGRFMALLRERFDGVDLSIVMDIERHLPRWQGQIHGLLAAHDDDIPVDESRAIIEAAGGKVDVLDHVGHRSVMWDPEAVRLGVAFLTG